MAGCPNIDPTCHCMKGSNPEVPTGLLGWVRFTLAEGVTLPTSHDSCSNMGRTSWWQWTGEALIPLRSWGKWDSKKRRDLLSCTQLEAEGARHEVWWLWPLSPLAFQCVCHTRNFSEDRYYLVMSSSLSIYWDKDLVASKAASRISSAPWSISTVWCHYLHDLDEDNSPAYRTVNLHYFFTN